MPSLTVILGALLAMVLSCWGSFLYGEHRQSGLDETSYRAKIEAQNAQAEAALASATEAYAARQHEIDRLNVQTESDHADHQHAIDAAHADLARLSDDNARLSAELGRLHQRPGAGSGPGDDHAVRGGGAAAQHDAAGAGDDRAGACENLLAEGARLLVEGGRLATDLANERDSAVERVRSDRAWALGVTKTTP